MLLRESPTLQPNQQFKIDVNFEPGRILMQITENVNIQ